MTGVAAKRPSARLACAFLGLIGVVAVVLVALADQRAALQGWLAAAFAFAALPLGALALLMLHTLVGGLWRRTLGPSLLALVRMLPLVALAFIPVIAAPTLLYPWAAATAGADPEIAAKAAWLNPVFFAARTVGYFLVWMTMSAQVRADYREDDRGNDRLGAAVGIIVLAITVSFAAIDWGMSLNPPFASSSFGLLVAFGNLLAALALAIMGLAWLGPAELRAEADRPRSRGVLAGLLASGVLLWAYLAFMQYLVVWSADLPAEAAWYLARVAGAWAVVPWLLGLLLGVFPLIALALPGGRRSLTRLAAVAALVLVMRFVDAVRMITPAFPCHSWLQPVALMAALFGLGGLCLACALPGPPAEPASPVGTDTAHG